MSAISGSTTVKGWDWNKSPMGLPEGTVVNEHGVVLPSKIPDLSGVPLDLIPALGGDDGPSFGSSI